MNRNSAMIAGVLIHKINNLLVIGDKLIINTYRLEIIEKDGQCIDKIMVTRKPD